MAIGLAVAAGATTNPLLHLLMIGAIVLVVVARRGDSEWSGSLRIYLWLALAIVVVRTLYRVVFGGGDGGPVVLPLPGIEMPEAVGFRLLGPVTLYSLLGGLFDGLRLATIILCVGAANSLVNPRRLLATLPAALYEIGTVLVVAVNAFVQLADSARRVARARRLRSGRRKGVRGWLGWVQRVLVPVLTDAIERSVRLAESMDVRGFGRTEGSRRGQHLVGAAVIAGLCLLLVAVYVLLSGDAPMVGPGGTSLAGWPLLVAGLALTQVGFWAAGRQVRRTRYRPERWGVAETLVAVLGLAPGVVYLVIGQALLGVWPADMVALHPSMGEWPTLTLATAAPLVGVVLLAFLTPPPALTTASGQTPATGAVS
ncbi:CbiQ family ECF transporter T component [Parenemella sanctibonifatiensis]|uniref:Cobalt ABC transporter permease n=1 Tax=Parenemella sanctibonifatiensis TaxID=2016505 RepID=A0A255ELW7_9ACTN|nr:CbiQ family ECF transporter T component [Parenemella sanctibonifatiensis]OYN92484.1 cobalt ABC transporter permease [Parenemella sanctibonifatiensis]